jgi:hypothetical protein
VKALTLPDFLTEDQIAKALALYKRDGIEAKRQIQTLVIEPNMDAINEKIGQENDASYLAYMVVHTLWKSTQRGN